MKFRHSFIQFIRGQSVTQRGMGREASRYPPQYPGPYWTSRLSCHMVELEVSSCLTHYCQLRVPIILYYILNPLTARIFTVFGHSLLEDRALHKEAWVAKLLGTHLSIQVHKKVKFSWRDNSSLAVKGLRKAKWNFQLYKG